MKNKNDRLLNDKEGVSMSATVQEYGYLDLSKLRRRASKIISTEESLQDVTPIDWTEDVLAGKKMVHISKIKDE